MPKSRKTSTARPFTSTEQLKDVLYRIESNDLKRANELVRNTPLPTLENILKQLSKWKGSKSNVTAVQNIIELQIRKLNSINSSYEERTAINHQIKHKEPVEPITRQVNKTKDIKPRKKLLKANKFEIRSAKEHLVRLVKLFTMEKIDEKIISDVLSDKSFEKITIPVKMKLVVSSFYYMSQNRICCAANKIGYVLYERFNFETQRSKSRKSVTKICGDHEVNSYRSSQNECIEGIYNLMSKSKSYTRPIDKKAMIACLEALQFDKETIKKVFAAV